MSKVLVLGAAGMLGHRLCHRLRELGHLVVGTIRGRAEDVDRYHEVFDAVNLIDSLDVTDDAALADVIAKQRPQAIVNAVGIVKQLPAAQNRLASVAINSYLPHRLAKLAQAQGSRLIHISTDCVFSGHKGGYTEDDPSDAEDIYGKSKFLGETEETQTAAVTLRTSFIGREIHHSTHGLLEWFLSQRGKMVRGFTRAIYSGLTSMELSDVIEMVISRFPGLSGVYQVAGPTISKYDLLLLIRSLYGLDVEIQREEQSVCDRSMDARKFVGATEYHAPSWEQMIYRMQHDALPYDSWKAGG